MARLFPSVLRFTADSRFLRYLLAGEFFSVVLTVGFLFCVLPGIALGR